MYLTILQIVMSSFSVNKRYPNHNLKTKKTTTISPRVTSKKDTEANPKIKATKRDYKHHHSKNVTTYVKKKLPRLIPPYPFGITIDDPIRPFPDNSIFTLLPLVIIPFIPFGVWDGRLALAWQINYLIERFNGYHQDDFTLGRSDRSHSSARGFAYDQIDFYHWAGNMISDSFGMDGKACVQRLICELAEAPVNQRSLMGDLLHRLIE